MGAWLSWTLDWWVMSRSLIVVVVVALWVRAVMACLHRQALQRLFFCRLSLTLFVHTCLTPMSHSYITHTSHTSVPHR